MQIVRCCVAALAAAAFAIQGCTPLKPRDDRRAADAGGSDPPCATHRQPPPKPSVVAVGGDLDLTFAPQSIQWGTGAADSGTPAWESIGFDLDSTCTGEGQGPSCVEPAWVTPERYHDGIDGIDNATGRLFSAIYPGAQDPVMTDPDAGTILVRVRGYAGDPDDDQVELSLYPAWGILPRPDGGTQLLWNGQDRWTVQPESVTPLEDGGYDLDQPLYRDPNAYVSQYTLVAHMDDLVTWAGGVFPGASVHMTKFVLEGHLVPGSGGWQLEDCVMAGRTPFNDYWRLMARYPDQSGQPLCKTNEAYESTKRILCSYLDIASTDASPLAPCDALSTATKTPLSKPAKIGGLGPRAPALAECAPGVSPETDICDAGVP